MIPQLIPALSGGPDAYLDFDFRFGQERYWINRQRYVEFGLVPGATSTGGNNLGQALRNGAWSGNLPDGTPLIGDGGLGVWEARANKCTNFNANPTDLTGVTTTTAANPGISVVDDVTEIAAAGLQNVCSSGKVYKIDNTLGGVNSDYRIGGATANTNAHSFSAWARVVGGNGDIGLSATTVQAIPGAAYSRVIRQNVTPASSGSVMQVRAFPGAVVYFILNQLEEGAFATPPIVVSGLAATRTAVAQSVGGLVLPPAFEARGQFRLGTLPSLGTFRRVFSFNDGTTNNEMSVFLTANGLCRLFCRNGGATQADIGSRVVSAGSDISFAAVFKSGAFSISVNNQAPEVQASGVCPAVPTLELGYWRTPGGNTTINGEIANLSLREVA